MKRTELQRRTPLARKPSTLKRGPVSPASPGQRAKVTGAVSIVSGEHGTEAAHLWPRGLGGCDDPLCVVPLTRAEHREYDLGELDLLPFLVAHGMVDEMAHALGHARGDLLGLAGMLTGVRWVPEGERTTAA
jgi:hypothetical protein